MGRQFCRVSIGRWDANIGENRNILEIYDGHNECDEYLIEANYPVEVMQQAYKDTCKKIGLQMHGGQDFTGLVEDGEIHHWRYLLVGYLNSFINEEVIKILSSNGYDFEGVYGERDKEGKLIGDTACFSSETAFSLFMWFITYSMPSDFKYTQVVHDENTEATVKPINGWWKQDGLPFNIGYGVFV